MHAYPSEGLNLTPCMDGLASHVGQREDASIDLGPHEIEATVPSRPSLSGLSPAIAAGRASSTYLGHRRGLAAIVRGSRAWIAWRWARYGFGVVGVSPFVLGTLRRRQREPREASRGRHCLVRARGFWCGIGRSGMKGWVDSGEKGNGS